MKLGKAIAQRMKTLRETSGLSQQDVAVRAGLSMSLVAKLEQGKKADPRASTILALAKALSVRPGNLLEDLFPAGGKDGSPAEENGAGEATVTTENGGHTALAAEEAPPSKPKAKRKKQAKKKHK